MSNIRWHLSHLDSLRGIAVLGVLLVHASLRQNIQLPLPTLVAHLAATGQRGVALFFIVSAFTLFLSYDNRKDEQNPIINFFIRRLFRLAPMFYIAIFLTFLFLPIYLGRLRHILLSVLFINGFHPDAIAAGAAGGWSIADEAIFYACLPFLFSRIRTLKAALIWLFIGSAVGYKSSQALAMRFPGRAEYFQFFSFSVEFPIFLMGIAGYFIWKELITTTDLAARKKISIMLLAVDVLLFRALLPFNYHTLYQSSVVCLLLLVALSLYPWPLFVNPATRFLGKISYSIYLLHFYIFIHLQEFLYRSGFGPSRRFLICFVGTLTVTIPLAYLTWRWIEEPGIRLGRHVIARLEERAIRGKNAEIVPS
jgi:peptidoglycan/LPS O-acetylase OafA/YrhL